MRKSFTWFLSLLVFLFVFAINGIAQEQQKTVELYAEDASSCYMEANDYTVTISVRDFIKLSRFDLNLQYNDAVFAFTGVSGLHSSLAGTTVGESGGVINIAWSGTATTIGDNVKTDVLDLHFSVLGFPGNTATSFTSDMEWTTSDFWYETGEGEDAVNTDISTDGSLAVSLEITGIEVEFTSETCSGGDVTVTVTAPDADMYLFNEDPVVANWDWTDSSEYLVSAGDIVTIRVKDADGCISLVDVVNVPVTIEPVAYTVTTQDPTCYGSKGSVVINASGGSATYEYWIGTASDGSDAVKKSNFQFAMAPGTYYVSVQDSNGCADPMVWTAVTITDNNPVLDVDAVPTDVLCYGASTGSIATSVAAGDLTMVSLDGVVWETLPYTFEVLPADTNTVWAKNDVGCTITESVIVGQPAEGIAFDIEIDDTSCGGGVNDGGITVQNVTGGTGPYEYSLDGETWTNDPAFTGLAPTYYSLWVRDANGCTVAYSNPNGTGNTIAVQSPEDIQFYVEITDPVCNDDDAIVEVTNISGGTGSYEISFDGGSTWGTVASASWPAPYADMDVMVRNDSGDACEVTKSLIVDDVYNPDPLVVITGEELAPTCIDGNDGNVTLLIQGGYRPYYYTVNGSSEKMTEDAVTHIRLNVGTHTITVRDARGCEYDTDIEVTITLEENQIVATKDLHIDCFGSKVGTISVDFNSWAEGVTGNAPTIRAVEYYIQNADGQVSSFEPSNQGGTPTLFNAGIYTVWVVDQYTCESNMDTVLITQNPELLIADVTSNAASCYESFEGIITVYARGGNTPDLEYAVVNNEGALRNITDDKWLPFDTYNNVDYNPPLSTVSFNVDGGTYWIAVRDDNCAELTYGPIEVEGYKELLVDEEEIVANDPLCYDTETGSISVPLSAVSGGAGKYYFTLLEEGEGWYAVEDMDSLATGDFMNLPAGTYAVLVEDSLGCPSYLTDPITLVDPSELTFTTTYLHMSCEDMNDGLITVTANGGTPDYWYAINNTSTWVAFGAGKVTKTYIATEPGTFTIWVKDANGCIADEVEVTILEPTALGADTTVTDATCYGTSTGEISVVGTGGWEGMSSYEFKVNNGTWTSSTMITGLPAGNHVLYVRDVNVYGGNYQQLDCVYEVPFTVGQPEPITYDVTITDVKCKDGADGTLTVDVLSGGTPWVDLVGDTDGYDIRITGDAYDSGWKRTGIDYSYTFTGLEHSIYTVYVMDANGCTLAPTVGDDVSPWTTIESWEIAEPDTYLYFEATWLNDVTCYNGEDGSFKVDASGGAEPPYKYYAGLSIPPNGGGHILVPAPDADSDEWMDNDTLMVGAGTWVVWVMDSNGCIIGGETNDMGQPVNEWRVKVMQPDSIMWDWHWVGSDPAFKHYQRPSCFGTWDGQIHLTNITGGSGVYNAHVWGYSAAGDTVDLSYTDIELDGGLYKLGGVPSSDADGFMVTVTDDNGCVSEQDTIFIGQPDELMVSLQESPDNYSCFGAVEGWIEATATGGNGDIGVYEYQLLKNGVVHTPWQSVASAFLVQVGNEFIVQVRDVKGCMTEDTLWMPTPAKVEWTYEDLTCNGVEKPSVKIMATGTEGRQFKVWYKQIEEQPVNAPYIEYNGWFDSEIIIDDAFNFDNENYDDLHYAIYVEDDHGCMSPVDTLTFDQVQTPLTVSWTTDNVTECSEDVMVTSILGGVAPYVIMVNDSVIALNETYTMARGMNMVKVMDAHMCSVEETIDVMGEYVTRDTTINTYIGEETQFVDAESGLDTMLAVGMYEFVYTVDCERTLNVTVVEVPREYAIKDVQGDGDTSPVEGGIAKIMGTVTGVAAGEGFFVQDASEAWSGIWVEYTDVDVDGIKVGDAVSVVGEVAEVANVTTILATEVMMEGTAMEIAAVEVAPSDAEAEMYESVLVKVPGARATSANEVGQWTVYYEPTDDIVVNDWLYSFAPADSAWYDVTGIVNGRLDAFKLEPRMESDIVASPTNVKPRFETAYKVYPNPFNDKIYIDNNDKLTRVVITNIAGQRVIDIEYPEREIRTANLVSGVYLVNLFTESGLAKTDRIVKR